MGRVAISFPTDVVDYLGRHHIITVSTSSFTGMPHADTMAFANDEGHVYFVVMEGSTVLRNVRDNRYASFTIDDYTTDWRKVRELHGKGECRRVDESERVHALQLLSDKFRRTVFEAGGAVHLIRPLEMHFVDYDYGVVNAEQPAMPEMTSRVFDLDGTARPPQYGAMATMLDRSFVSAGTVVFRPGDPPGQFYVIVDGEIEVRGEGHGVDQTVVRLGPGQLFGDQATLRGQSGLLTAHATKDTLLLAMDREAVQDLILQQH